MTTEVTTSKRFNVPHSPRTNASLNCVRFLLTGILFLTLVQSPLPTHAQTPFSLDSAAAYLKTIAVDIGARPMGSPHERRAMEFALRKFREFGLNETYLMPIREAPAQLQTGSLNTRSGVAVGVLKGTSERIIVIGAHIDSDAPEVPGANDDGSGTAVVIELARVLSQRTNESTIVFALFGGEEKGLVGSKYFVENFPRMGEVALMLQVDMANGLGWLVPTIESDSGSSPEWLVRASYEELERLGHSGLFFPTHFFTLMDAMPGGGIGSDHQPFLEKNIPAIDFTSDFRDPIHTPQDNMENFRIEGLQRSGALIYALVERFDGGVPEETAGHYYLVQLGPWLLFFPLWSLKAFVGVALLLVAWTLFQLRHRRIRYESEQRPILPGLKLFLLMLILQTFVWLSENVVGLIAGVRYPWYADLDGYWILAFLGGMIGIWIGMQLAPRLNLRRDPYAYFLRSVVWLLLFLLPLSMVSARIALSPAMALFFLSLSMLVKKLALRWFFWIVSPHFMFQLFFGDGFGFLARVLHSSPELGIVGGIILHLVFILFFSLWAFPFLLGFAALWYETWESVLWLKRYRAVSGLAVATAAFAVCLAFLATRPAFSQEWKQSIWIEQEFDLNGKSATMTVRSPEYLSGTRIRYADRDTVLSSRDLAISFDGLPLPPEPWIMAEREVESHASDTVTTLTIRLHLTSRTRPYRMTATYSSLGGSIVDVNTPAAFTRTENTVAISWYSFPDTSLSVPLTITLKRGGGMKEKIEGIFVEEPVPVLIEKEGASFIRRAVFRQTTNLDTGS